MILQINDRIKIRTIDYFNDVNINLKYDSVGSTFSFGFYFDPHNHDQEELSCVSHFHEAIIKHNNETLITGYILSEIFDSGPQRQLVNFSGYSKTGVLEDCTIDQSIKGNTLQFDGLNLQQIASKLIAPFKIKMVIDPAVASQMNVVYSQTTADITQTIKDYLTELATQRNIIISHDGFGNLLFTKAPIKQQPSFHVEKGIIATSMHLNFNGQNLHSSITVVKQAESDGANPIPYTINNPYVPIVYRPKTIVQSSGDDNASSEVAMNVLANELKSGIVITITTDRWIVNGKLIRPGMIISILNPEIYIYKTTNLFIESVNFTGNSANQTTTITCVLPEVYNGQMPKNIFVDPHKNSATGYTSNI